MNSVLRDKSPEKLGKSKLLIFILICLLLISVLLITSENHKKSIKDVPVVEKGVLDLSDWDFARDGIVNLEGEWEFYWQKLLTPQDFSAEPLPQKDFFFVVPDIVNNYQAEDKEISGKGYFTYRVILKLKEGFNKNLALKFSRTSGTALRIWINDKLVLTEGKPGKNKAEMIPGWVPEIINFKPEKPKVEIVVQASNYYHYKSGLAGSTLLGLEEQIRTAREGRIVFDMLLFGALLIMSFYHLGLFIFRPKDSSPLYFSLFCLIVNIRLAVTGEAYLVEFFNLSYGVIYKMLLSYYLAVPVFCLFIASLYPREFSKKVLTGSQILGVSFYLFVILVPTEISSFTLPYELITLFFSCYCLYSIVLAVIRGKEGALLLLIGFSFLFIFIINDLLYSSRIINTGYYFHLGLFVFVLFQSFILSKRFMSAFSRIEFMSEQLKEKNTTLVQMDKFKDEFIASTSKEFKLPLNTIISSAESIIYNYSSFLQDSLIEDLAAIISTGKGLNYMINNFIDYSNIKQGDIDLNKEKLEVYEIIEYTIKFFKPFVGNKDINFYNNIKQKSFIVRADKSRLIQVIYNLLDDVCRFTEKGMIFFSAVKKDDKIEIILEITADNILFRYQNDNSGWNDDRKFILDKIDIKQNVTMKLIKLQGGELKIKKTANKLLSISVILPREEYTDFYELDKDNDQITTANEMEKDIVEPVDRSPQQQKSILIIGNKSSNLSSLKDLLILKNYSIQIIENRKKAVEKLNNNVVMVILNLFALNKSALELCKQIRQRFTIFDLPVLMMVSRSNPEDLIRGFEVGINDFIKKPFEISELKARVRTLITLKERVEESVKREQDFLRAQIKPHFLYNTLNAIAFLCKNNPKQASDLIIDLASYLRYSFDFESLNQIVSIKKELELVDFYVNIQQARFKDKIKVKYNIEEGLVFGVPPLMLQPIVENAIKHGILKREIGGTIEINIKRKEDYFVIRVVDDGVGMTEEELANLFTTSDDNKRKRVGFKNINKRLKKLYNEDLRINSTKGQGTIVEFKIPKNNFITKRS